MSISRRKHIRFSLEIPAIRYTKDGERVFTFIQQVSVGGCLAEWDEDIVTGDEFRLEIQLPNRNWLPLTCKALYRSDDNGIGTKFLEITKFEQELVGKIIAHSLEQEGLPIKIDPFAKPNRIFEDNLPNASKINDEHGEKEDLLEIVMTKTE